MAASESNSCWQAKHTPEFVRDVYKPGLYELWAVPASGGKFKAYWQKDDLPVPSIEEDCNTDDSLFDSPDDALAYAAQKTEEYYAEDMKAHGVVGK